MWINWKVPLLVVALLGAGNPVSADAPDPVEVLRQWDKLYVAKRYDEADVLLTRALDAARAFGPLSSLWSYVMSTGAVAKIEDGCEFTRAQALFDEAVALAETRGDAVDQSWTRIMRAHHYARFGQKEAAQADIDAAEHSPDLILSEERTRELNLWLRINLPFSFSFGFLECSRILTEDVYDAMNANDTETATRLARGLMMPPAYESDWRVLEHNLNILRTLATAAVGAETPEQAAARLDDAIARSSEPGSEPPALRSDIQANAEASISILRSLDGVLVRNRDNPAASRSLAILQGWKDGLSYIDASPQAILDDIARARANSDWAGARDAARKLLLFEGLDPSIRITTEVQEAIYAAFLANEQRQGGSHLPRLVEMRREVLASDSIAALSRGEALFQLGLAFGMLGDTDEVFNSWTEAWRVNRQAARDVSVTGETFVAITGRSRVFAADTIAIGFDLSQANTGMRDIGRAVCKKFLGRNACTLIMVTP